MNAESWLMKVNSTLYSEVGEAGRVGASGGMGDAQCSLKYPECFTPPASYIHPGVSSGTPYDPLPPPEVYQPLLNEVMDVVKKALL